MNIELVGKVFTSLPKWRNWYTRQVEGLCSLEREGSSPSFGTRTVENILGRLAQLARASRLHRGGRGFESLSAHTFTHSINPFAGIAQLVEQRIENPCVGGSSPPPGTIMTPYIFWSFNFENLSVFTSE